VNAPKKYIRRVPNRRVIVLNISRLLKSRASRGASLDDILALFRGKDADLLARSESVRAVLADHIVQKRICMMGEKFLWVNDSPKEQGA